MLAGQHVVDLFDLFTVPFDRGPGAEIVVDRAAVVMAKLHDDVIAALELRQNPRPLIAPECSAARAAQGTILDIDLLQIEIRSDRIAPAPLPVPAVVRPVL